MRPLAQSYCSYAIVPPAPALFAAALFMVYFLPLDSFRAVSRPENHSLVRLTQPYNAWPCIA